MDASRRASRHSRWLAAELRTANIAVDKPAAQTIIPLPPLKKISQDPECYD